MYSDGWADRPDQDDSVQVGDFDDFVRTRSASLLRSAYLLVGDEHTAQDLLQEVLEGMYVHWRRIRASPESYARRALVHRATNRWRWRRRRPEAALLPDHDRSVSDHADTYATQDLVVRALRDLPPRQRAVVVLRYLDDLSEAETAALLGCSIGSVKSHASRGLARLRPALAALQSDQDDRSEVRGHHPQPAGSPQ